MNKIRLNSGFEIPVLGLGTWQSEKGLVKNAVAAALECGYRHIDAAWAYGNEDEVGEAIEEFLTSGKAKREDLFVTTKLWNTFHNPADVEPALEESLRALRLKYVDLYLLHWPRAVQKGAPNPVPPEAILDIDYVDTYKAMEKLISTGKVRSIGVSNFGITKLERILSHCDIIPAMNQVEMHPYFAQNDLVKFCQSNNIAMTAYAPLGSPARPARLIHEDQPVLMEDPVVQTIASKYNATPAQVLLRWGIQRGHVVIPKSTTPSRIRSNFECLRMELTQEDLNNISSLNRNLRFINPASFRKPGQTEEDFWEGSWF